MKIYFNLLLIVISFTLSTVANGGYDDEGMWPSSSNGGSSSNLSTSSSDNNVSQTYDIGQSTQSCDSEKHDKTISPGFLKNMLGFKRDIKFKAGKNNKFRLSLSQFLNIDKCFKPKISINKLGNDKIIRFRNEVNLNYKDYITYDGKDPKIKHILKNFSRKEFRKVDESGKDVLAVWRDDKKKLKKLSEEEKIVRCMAIKYPHYFRDDYKDVNKGDTYLDFKAMNKNSKSWVPYQKYLSSKLRNDEAIDKTKTSKYFFGTPRSSNDEGRTLKLKDNSTCFKIVNINSKTHFANKTNEDLAFLKLRKGCNSQDPFKFMEGMELLDEHFTGNAKKLAPIVNNLYVGIIKGQTDKLSDLEKELIKNVKQAAKAIRELDEDSADSDEVDEATDDYLDALAEYESKILNPTGKLLKELEVSFDKYKGGSSDLQKEMKKKISNRMKDLKEIASRLYDEGDVKIEKNEMTGAVIDKIKKIVSPSTGKEILSVMLKSREYGKICSGKKCGKGKVKLKKAVKIIEKRENRFDDVDSEDWIKQRAAHRGSDEPLRDTKQEINHRQKRLMSRLYLYKNQETKAYNRVCGTQYKAIDCLIFKATLKSKRKAFTGGLQGEASYIKTLGRQYNNLSSIYASAQRRIAASGDTNLTDSGVDFSKFFNDSALGANLDPNLLFSLHGNNANPNSMDQSVQQMMLQQQLIQQQRGLPSGVNAPYSMQPSPFMQNAGGTNGFGNTLLLGR